MPAIVYESELYHHGVQGQKWGVRRFQNKDGSLTKSGAIRYGSTEKKTVVPGSTEKKTEPQGVAKSNQNGTSNLQNASSSARNSRTSMNKKLNEMSDDELRSVINRIEQENKYRSLTYKPTAGQKLFKHIKESAKKPLHDMTEQVIALGLERITNSLLKSLKIANADIKLSKSGNDKKDNDSKKIGKELYDSLMSAAEAEAKKKNKK